jgi:uncharacterized protein
MGIDGDSEEDRAMGLNDRESHQRTGSRQDHYRSSSRGHLPDQTGTRGDRHSGHAATATDQATWNDALIYPGATHSRFSHSLGALRAAQDLLDAAVTQRFGPDYEHDLFEEWESAGSFDVNLARATVLIRLGAVTHDMCHVPYGHSVEDELKFLLPHDKNVERFEALWKEMVEALPEGEMQEALRGDLGAALRPLILSKEHDQYILTERESPYPFAADIVGNTICADLLDYLRRDHLYTGLPLALGRRFVDGFYVARTDRPYYGRHMVVRVARGGRIRHDVITELFKYLRYRYELSERALNHHAKVSGDAMVAKMLEMWRDQLFIKSALSDIADLDLDKTSVSIVESKANRAHRR